MKIISANYVLPISSEPIENGAIAIEKGKIATIGTRDALAERFPDSAREDFGEAAILPGFVNCHSHLEVTAMRGFLDSVEHDFYAWLMKLTTARENLSPEDLKDSAIAGALEGASAGITCFGDIGRFGRAGFEGLKATGLRGVLFQETMFSPDNKTADEDFAKLKEKFLALKDDETDLVKIGLSPHSPYTVSPKLFEKIADFASGRNVKITVHASESREEEELMQSGSGLFADLLKKFGANWESPRCSSIDYLGKIGVLQTRPLLAHCVKVSDKDIELLAAGNSSIAHCPKSNAKFGHGYAPLEKFLDAGINVGFGSDSVASNNTCDLLEESRFGALSARNRSGTRRFITAKEAMETATLGGAKALGLDQQIGTLEQDKQADITVISLAHIAQQPIHDVHAAMIFASNARDVVMTMVAGKVIYRRQ